MIRVLIVVLLFFREPTLGGRYGSGPTPTATPSVRQDCKKCEAVCREPPPWRQDCAECCYVLLFNSVASDKLSKVWGLDARLVGRIKKEREQEKFTSLDQAKERLGDQIVKSAVEAFERLSPNEQSQLASSVALAGDNWLGTWKLDVAKSKASPGPGPKSLMLKFDATPAGIKLTTDSVSAEGKAIHGGYVSKFDGKDVPWEGNPEADMASPKKIDDNSYENTWKKGGKVTIVAKVVVSKDGKTLTVTQTGTDSKGRAVNYTAVYDRQ